MAEKKKKLQVFTVTAEYLDNHQQWCGLVETDPNDSPEEIMDLALDQICADNKWNRFVLGDRFDTTVTTGVKWSFENNPYVRFQAVDRGKVDNVWASDYHED